MSVSASQIKKIPQPVVPYGCPSWIHIELCAGLQSQLFARFWRMYECYISARRYPVTTPHAKLTCMKFSSSNTFVRC